MVKFYSSITNKYYDSLDEATAAENEIKHAQEKREENRTSAIEELREYQQQVREMKKLISLTQNFSVLMLRNFRSIIKSMVITRRNSMI